MNRIYQGKVMRVEIPDGKAENGNHKWKPLGDWKSILWRHHELFQDAVNYYTLALAAMAEGVQGDSAQAKALRDWVAKVRETWANASRKAEIFDGPKARLTSILKLGPDKSRFEDAANHVLRSSRATAAQRAGALMQLLMQKGGLNQVCVAGLPWLATPAGKLDATSKIVASSQESKRQKVVRQYHQISDRQALAQAPSLDLGLFLAQPPVEFVEGTGAEKMLRDYFAKATAKFSELKPITTAFDKFITKKGDTLKIPSPGRKPSGLYPIAAVFKFFPTVESLVVFRKATQTLAGAKDKEIVSDAVAESRVADQPHFDYFTNLALVTGGEDERDTRAIWFEFDLAAFIEAIKAPRRYFEDTLKRETAADRLRQQIDAMENRGRESSGAEEEDESLPGFEDDPRIELLKSIVQKKLAWLGEAESEMESEGPKEYTIRERTVRGFGEIKKRWRDAVRTGKETGKHLLQILAREQTERHDDFGSATLYRELAKPENHPIWRDGGTQPWHAEDPLDAWLDYKELQSELQDKERPIRFTPAHPKCSPRFFIFPKKSEAQPKTLNQRPPKPGLLSHHERGQLSFTAGVILPTEHGPTPTGSEISLFRAASLS